MDKGESLSVRRAVGILRLFREPGRTLSLGDVVQHSGLSKTACHRFLSTWVVEGFLSQDKATGRYAVGPQLISFARSHLGVSSLRDTCREWLEKLAKETGDVALLYVVDADTALCLERFDGNYPVRVAGVEVGGRLPLHCGGGPLALLGFSQNELVERVLSKPLPRRTAHTLVTRQALRRCISETRARGYAIGNQDAFEYVVAVGAPIFNPAGLVGSISVGGIEPRYRASRIAEIGRLVRGAADRITERFGGHSLVELSSTAS